MKKIYKLLVLAVFTFSVILVFFYYAFPYVENKKYHFSLQGSKGEVKLSDFYNQNLIIYFGYVSCPDACPSTLHTLKSVFKKVGNNKINDFKVLFISIDPERDKAKDIDEYVQFFIPNSLGATGSSEELNDLRKPYKLFYAKGDELSKSVYFYSHTSSLYFFKKRNVFYKKIESNEDERFIIDIINEMI